MTGYCTVAELRGQLNDSGNRLDATELQNSIDAASREIDQYCHRRFDLDAGVSARVYPGGACLPLLIDDVGSSSGLLVETTLDGTTYATVAASNYELQPLNADVISPTAYAWWWLAESPAYTTVWAWSRRIRVTARWGWSAAPAQVKQATLLRAAALFKRQDATYGVAGFGEFGVVRIRLDPDVAALLAPLVKPEGIA